MKGVTVGDVLAFKAGYDAQRYGATATVARISESIDLPHPGRLHRTWVDLVTANGTKVQWPPATVRSRFRIAK